MGNEIDYESKYANMLVVILMAMTYGPGIPIMYVIACFYFFIIYWKDKFMVFYNCRKPLYFDETLAL